MLVETYQAFERPLNWTLERWNYARYFVAPFLGAYGLANTPNEYPDTTNENSKEAIRFWENSIGVWENKASEIVAVVCPDEHVPWHPVFGQPHFQRRPQYDFLLKEMLDYADATFRDRQRNLHKIWTYEHDESLNTLLQNQGYEQDAGHPDYISEFIINQLPESKLAEGYAFRSMQDENNLEKRRKIFGRAFRHPDPKDWPTIFSYQELQRAPDYRKDLDIYIVGPDGEYTACCIVWFDERNRTGIFEPVGSILLGHGREVVMEGIRRIAALGVRKTLVGTGQRFYLAIGFQRKYTKYRWMKKL